MSRTFSGALDQWLALHSLGRKPRSIEFNQEITSIIAKKWPGYLNAPDRAVTSAQVMTFAGLVTHYSSSRWNALVSALRFITSHAAALHFRPVRTKERALISTADFARLLDELRSRPRSHGALVVEFLARTGLRINAARWLRWSDVKEDCLCVAGVITKNGRPQSIPFINGLREVLEKLRTVAAGARADFILPQRECKTALLRSCAATGLPRLTHHDFRHLFATRCITSGVDLPTVARWLGHQDGGALLAKTYFHLVDEHSRRMAGRVKI